MLPDNFISHWYVFEANVLFVLYYHTFEQVVILSDYLLLQLSRLKL